MANPSDLIVTVKQVNQRTLMGLRRGSFSRYSNMSAGSMLSNRSKQSGGRFNEDHEKEDDNRELVKILVIVYIILNIAKNICLVKIADNCLKG